MIAKAVGEQREVYVVVGIVNYWAVFAGLLSSLVIIGYCVTEIVKKKSPISFLSKGIIISCVIISPIVSFTLKEITSSRVNGYAECEDLSKLSTRFSSRTYAINSSTCLELEERKGPTRGPSYYLGFVVLSHPWSMLP